MMATSGEERRTEDMVQFTEGWHRISISFNRRALKIYVDEQRVVNAPNVAQGNWFSIETRPNGGASPRFFVKNVRIAKGAVPLYDRMMSDGKFITYGITFDVGKSTIKPESMGEINRIVTLLKENPALKFSVEGHTDSTGSAATNQTLSEARSQAVVDKLVSMGIAADRLKAAGKGQTSPIADNGTDEGRAKNRRVEFVKM
jgi:outer membrane protein OmpA-like peptidoglycan-associated protein